MEQHGEAGAPSPVWAPDGKHFAFFQGGKCGFMTWPRKSEKTLLSLAPLGKAAVPVPEPPRFDWQNRRVSEDSLEWSQSGRQLLLSVKGDLFLFSLATGAWRAAHRHARSRARSEAFPRWRARGFPARPRSLYSLEIASKQVTRLTDDGSATLLNGELDWVYPEELDLSTAYWWAPDSKRIAYLQFDTAREFTYPQVALRGLRAVAEPERYPQAGTANPEVRVGVVPTAGGATRWIDLGDTRGFLISRVYWTPDSTGLAIERLNRVQNRLDLCSGDASPEGLARS